MVASLVTCLDIGPVFRMNGHVQELLRGHSVIFDQSGLTVSLSRRIGEKWIEETSLGLFQCSLQIKVIRFGRSETQ